ncbi:DUF4405 domain-containing protein [Methanohalophilus sp.]|uniref:DUF4405 domain-containing protein n=1 Tax=Methanohalophilus sp. TaxID=1966352 RepID=UPI00262E8965|nr:DUF4405 domain-containing protein [Methanohalophilus sp.]MDK2892784.1 hypothetical protein [Methanohalophilus sp.]
MVNRAKLNYLVDIAILLLFIIVAITGFYMYLFIPSGVPQGRYQVYMGLTKATWTLIHNRTSIMLTIAVFVHIVLHYKWMMCMTGVYFGKSRECDK